MRKISISDTNTIWASGHNGTIIKSTNQGISWTVLPTNTDNVIMNHSVVNNNLAYAITWEFQNPPYGTYILKTTNGGSSWQKSFFPIEFEFLQSIYFFNENVGLVAGSKTYITTNGGIAWSQTLRDSDLVANLPFLNIKMLNDNYGFACGGFIDVAGVIWKTTNGGLSWKTNGISPDEIFDFVVLDSLNILALSGDPEFIYNLAFVRSTDGGQTWSYNELPLYAVSFGIDAKNANTIWSACGYKFIFTTDGGNNWNFVQTPDSVSVYDLVFVNNKLGFACGENGVLLKYTENVSHSLKEDNFLGEFKLSQNYPNPFNSSTKINLKVPTNGWVKLKIFDILGVEIATLIDDFKEAGEYSEEFPKESFGGENLTSGVYFYQIQYIPNLSQSSQTYIETKKMLYIK
ncbi:MAG: YCF48-related protein [Ignavibacterium sp.]|nr:YCF48-related protein [Ignavibacterium sp.]